MSNMQSSVTLPLYVVLTDSAAMASANATSAPYVLYYHPYSVCSLMVLYTMALKGSAISPENEINVETKIVDIFRQKQLDEDYLCDINKYGQVHLY